VLEDDALKFIEEQALADGATLVWFEHGRDRVGVTIERIPLGVSTPSSCGDPLEPRNHYRARSITR
jgi:hypothetical protein